MQKLQSLLAKSALVTLIIASAFVQVKPATAASLTTMTDNMSRIKASTASNHEIKFTTPSGVASGGIITLTFSAGFTGIGSLVGADFDFAEGSTGVCSSATFTEESVVTATPSTSQFSIAGAGQVVTITSGGATALIPATRCVRLRIGLNATDVTGSGPGVNQITNGAIGSSDTIAIAGSFGDTGTIGVEIITDDQVVVTATVDPTITFTIDDNAIGFGTLSSAAARYATANAAGSASEVSANSFTASTNATNGYIMYVKGDTLTSGANTITAIGGSPTASAVGTEQFGIQVRATGGSGASLAPYSTNSSYADAFNATTQDDIASSSGPSATTTYTIYYLANITPTTEAGSYATTLTYTVVGSF